MAFSYTQEIGDGSTTSYTFSFTGQDQGYLRDSDIEVSVDGTVVSFTLLSTNSLELDVAPANGSEIIIRRIMPKSEPYADFQRGNNFGQEVLNNSFLQLLYVVHELLDGWFPAGLTVREAVDYIEGLRSLSPDHNDPYSVLTFGTGDARYLKLSGGTINGALDMGDNHILVRNPVSSDEPAQKGQLDSEITNRQAGDSSIQSQLTGEVPLAASAFSPISWHDQVLTNSVTIPENKNAWSFGPSVTVAEGQSITISEGSFWTIANGEGSQSAPSLSYDGGIL